MKTTIEKLKAQILQLRGEVVKAQIEGRSDRTIFDPPTSDPPSLEYVLDFWAGCGFDHSSMDERASFRAQLLFLISLIDEVEGDSK